MSRVAFTPFCRQIHQDFESAYYGNPSLTYKQWDAEYTFAKHRGKVLVNQANQESYLQILGRRRRRAQCLQQLCPRGSQRHIGSDPGIGLVILTLNE